MKIENETLPSIPVAQVDQINLGETVFLVPDRAEGNGRLRESVVSDFKQGPSRWHGGPVGYIQLATLAETASQGAIIDGQGKLVGLLITRQKKINLAVPMADAERLAREGKAVPLGDLKGVRFTADALDLYLKGILARDAQRWDEAFECFKKALDLNPRLVGARLELAHGYYKKRLYDLEARQYEEVLKEHPENTYALFDFASNLETRQEYAKAIEKYEKVIALDPEDAETYYQLGLAYLAAGKKEKAMAVYGGLKKLDAGYAEMLRRLAR